ncbi:MAG: zinc dependent phospholipase C family protein [Candidatus Electrothrix scaldis]|jgi:hypothetical protein|nr:MAG: zinc dependent phospholipase C family protein [Candidatus Electrothrix sp. GW3-3]
MAGGYTHITIAQLAIEEAQRQQTRLHHEAIQSLLRWKKFAIIGSIAPDYPYMDFANSNSTEWSNVMHSWGSLDFIRSGIGLVRTIEEQDKREKCLAWLLGFAAHVVADVVIHPLVNIKVGPYEENKIRHRRCEMSQDVYIHPRLNLGLEINRQISTNVNETSDGRWSSRLDENIAEFWVEILEEVYGVRQSPPPFNGNVFSWTFAHLMRLIGMKGHDVSYPHPGARYGGRKSALLPPDPDAWHRAMQVLMQTAENGNLLIPFARHLSADQGLVYPKEADLQYVMAQKTPDGTRMNFDKIVDKTVEHLIDFWSDMSLALQGKASPLDTMPNVNLDTGIDEKNTMTYWS